MGLHFQMNWWIAVPHAVAISLMLPLDECEQDLSQSVVVW
jgi:hypothetical protein